MKKTLITLICLTLLLCRADAKEKVPGYMGLRFSLQYQFGVNPQWNNLGFTYMPYLSHNVQMGYVVSRKHEVGLQYTRIDYSSGIGASYYNSNSSTGSGYITADQRGFTGNNVMAYIKFFRARKGFIAPLGRYYLLGLNYQYSRDSYHVTEDASSLIGTPNITNVESHDLAITFGVGRNIILANRLLLTIEGDVHLPLTSGIRSALSGGNSGGSFNGITGSPNAYKHFNAVDVMLINLIQIKIGLGALLF